MDQATQTQSRYRYRQGGSTSPWMSGDELQEAAQAGVLEQTAEIQMAGHTEWRIANTIRGLSFTPVEGGSDDEPLHEEEDRLTRFGTIRELMAAFVRQDIEINLNSDAVHESANLCAIGTDHFEIIEDEGRKRTFIPLHRVRSVVAIDTGNQGSNYRENHLLRITLL